MTHKPIGIPLTQLEIYPGGEEVSGLAVLFRTALLNTRNALVTRHRDKSPENLKLSEPVPLNRHPASVYLSNLAQGSRPTMKQTLDAIASLLTSGSCDHLSLDWSKLRYHHTSSVRSVLIQRYAPATANKML